MPFYFTTQTYAPPSELKFRIRKLAEIAAIAELCNQTELYNQAKDAHDSIVSQYNSVAETKKKGFWGQFLDNLAFIETHIVMADYLEDDHDYISTYNLFRKFDTVQLIPLLNKYLKDLELGYDTPL